MDSQQEFLLQFGWSDFFANQVLDPSLNSFRPARVIGEERSLYRVQLGLEESMWAAISGKMKFSASARADFPAVGDWVLAEVSDSHERGIIHHIFDRRGVVQRKQVGGGSDMQIWATNIDCIFVTAPLSSFNMGGMERYLTIAEEAGAKPVILLTKADLEPRPVEEILAEVQLRFPQTAIHSLSKNAFENAKFFESYLRSGTTSMVVGASGVGKSTLINYLIGREQIKTQAVREGDGKGRHTTTARSLFVSRYGGLIIDTPGMREMQLSDHEEGLKMQFDDIEALRLECRFSDCKHQSEPGCAVQKAVSDGSLPAEKLESYRKLSAEIQFGLRKQDKAAQAEEKKRWKKLTQEGKARGVAKRRPPTSD